MKKFLRGVTTRLSAVIILVAVLFAGCFLFNNERPVASAGDVEISNVRIGLNQDLFEIESLEFYYENAFISYSDQKIEFDEDEYEVEVKIPQGETLEIFGSVEIKNLAVGGFDYYYLSFDELKEKMTFDASNPFPNSIPANKNSSVKFTIDAIEEDESMVGFRSQYFYQIQYNEWQIGGSFYNVFRPQIDVDGIVSVGGVFDAVSELYESEINTRKFRADFINSGDDHLVFEVVNADNIMVKFDATAKRFPVFVNGVKMETTEDDGFTSKTNVDNVAVTVPSGVINGTTYNFDFAPQLGKIIKKLDLRLGSSNNIFTLYGGMCDEQKDEEPDGGGAVLNYFFPAGLDITDMVVGVYGHYAFALDVHSNDYNYSFKSAGEMAGNPKFVVDVVDGETPRVNRYEITLMQNGKVRVTTATAIASPAFEVESQSFAQINLKYIKEGDVEDASSIAIESLKVDGVEVEKVAGEIPKSVFILDFENDVTITATLKDEYSYSKDYMDLTKINGRVFEDTILTSGGVINIYTEPEEKYFFQIFLKNEDGTAFRDAYTKIYISKNPDYNDESDFLESDLSLTSSMGTAKLYELKANVDVVKFLILISPYKMIDDGDDNCSVLSYAVFDRAITREEGNVNLVLTVKNIKIQKPVFYKGEELGTVRISLVAYSNYYDGQKMVDLATYLVEFKEAGNDYYLPIIETRPAIKGYLFKNIKLVDVADSRGIVEKYNDGTFVVNQTNSILHNYLASMVSHAGEEGFGHLEAEFAPRLIEFEFEHEGTSYSAKSYYDSYELYVDKLVQTGEPGKYFVGIEYKFENGGIGWVSISEDFVPFVMGDGEFEGLTRYNLTTPWNCDETDAEFKVLTEFRTFKITIVYTTEIEGVVDTIEGDIVYGTEFIVEKYGEHESPKYPGIGVYNHIGWIIEDDPDITYLVSETGECDIILDNSITYEWEMNVRFIPVFSANSIIVRFFDDANLLKSVVVHSNDLLEVEKFFTEDGNLFLPHKFGYNFLGFERNGELALSLQFKDDAYFYLPNLDSNSDIFMDVEGSIRWIASKNVDFYTSYDKIGYQLILEIKGSEFVDTDNITTNINEWSNFAGGKMSLDEFAITDELEFGGFAPNTNDAFIGLVKLGYGTIADVTYLDPELVGTCDADGVVSYESFGERFNIHSYSFNLVVNEFINEDTNADRIYITVEYLPITYLISFSANVVGENGVVIFEDSADAVYYKVTKENASINYAKNWILCDSEGVELGPIGWQTITTPIKGLVFEETSLAGISGVYYENGNVTYSFKSWVDLENMVTLSEDVMFTKSYNFVSIFTDDFDVTINYYIYNDVTKKYELDSYEGYFWLVDNYSGDCYLPMLYTANAYELYLIDGSLYYINWWSTELPEGFSDSPIGDSLAVTGSYEVEYQASQIVIDYYAIYNEYELSVNHLGNIYSANVSLPRDPNGNSYTSADVSYLTIKKTDYDLLSGTAYKNIDKLNMLLPTQEEIDDATLASDNGVLELDSVDSDYYLFAVIQRKVDNDKIPAFYIALKLN